MKRQIELHGVPMDLGAGRRGVDMGPAVIRYVGLSRAITDAGHGYEDRGDVTVPMPEKGRGEPVPRYGEEIRGVCEDLMRRVVASLASGSMPLVIGGDHSMSMGSIAGAAKYFHQRGEKLGLLWVDAHADMNTPETTLSGNVHGMPLAAVLGRGAPGFTGLAGVQPMVDPEHVALVGVREVDEGERAFVESSGIHIVEMGEVNRRGMESVMDEVLGIVSTGTGGLHLSIDVDAVDPKEAPGVGTPVEQGLSLEQAHRLCAFVAESGLLRSLDMAELNPILDQEGVTGIVCRDLIVAALGESG